MAVKLVEDNNLILFNIKNLIALLTGACRLPDGAFLWKYRRDG